MNRKIRILVIEDEVAIRSGLVDVFVYHGYEVEWAEEGLQGLEKALSGTFDLVLLDVMMPGMNGFDVCNNIRAQDLDLPIIMLTAKSGDEEIIQGLTLGADDYVAKPFSVAQLVARVQAVLRRAKVGAEQSNQITLGNGMTLDIANLCGRRDDESLSFTCREMKILQYLHAHNGRPISRDELLNKVWGYAKNMDIETRTVDIHIAKLRRKIEVDPTKPRYLITVRGAGYRLVIT